MKIQINDEEQMPNYTKGELDTLSSLAYPSQVTEIYAPTALNYVSVKDVHTKMMEIAKLMRAGGKLIIGGVDCYLLSDLLKKRALSEKEFNDLLFGDEKFKATHSLQGIKFVVQRCGFKIEEINVENDEARFTIEAYKNE